MNIEKRDDNVWIISGQTFAVKDRLKALGGKWNPTAKVWEFQAGSRDRQHMLSRELETLSQTNTQQREDRYNHLNDVKENITFIEDDSAKVCNVEFWRDTFVHRSFLRAIGARWDDHCWILKKTVNKERLLQAVVNEDIPFDVYSYPGRGIREKGFIIIDFEYDSEKHRKISVNNGCTCTSVKTCRPCKLACCELARISPTEGFSGERFECPTHNVTEQYGTWD
uniref:Uncharacterized protein n=1 Tax=Marseillevirus LCMAC201 TaxID=2506605 RepID=A0A481YWK6_9VIRU|nr:MAG: hypothetical protein LCMAC201_03100 [Marseillevirus LCMAC201]